MLIYWPLPAFAEDAPPKLPANGSWVRYNVTARREGSNNDDATFTRMYSLVGTTTEEGQPCRWVEMKTVHKFDGKEKTDILKFLIPEIELLQSEKPLNSLVRTWRKIDDGDAKLMTFDQESGVEGTYYSRLSADSGFGRDLFLLPGPQRKSKRVNQRNIVEYQRGRLEIAEGRSGKHISSRMPRVNGQRKLTIVLEFTVWNHPAVPLGCAAAKDRVEYLIDDVPSEAFESEWVVEDFGTDAKSAIPDKN
jgi:hypothetical protein